MAANFKIYATTVLRMPSSDDNEVLLAGGTTNPVVRVGSTVRRHMGTWSTGVHALLLHLEQVGYPAPRVLGVDNVGRETLTYIDGEVTATGMVAGQSAESTLIASARLLRGYHDAISGFSPPVEAQWRIQPGAPSEGSIICHNDLGPHNTIYRSGKPYAFIDWDFAAPGTPLWDLVYAAWLFVPLFDDERSLELGWVPANKSERLVAFCNAYGLVDRSDFIATLLQRQQVTHDLFTEWGAAGVTGFPALLAEGRDVGVLRDMAFTRQNAERWHVALMQG